MTPLLQQLFQYLAAPMIAGFVAAYFMNMFSSHYSFKRFRREQWWTEKREAYHSIIRTLTEVVFYENEELENLETGLKSSKVQKNGAFAWSLQQIVASGAYIVTEKTVAAVDEALAVISESHGRENGAEYIIGSATNTG